MTAKRKQHNHQYWNRTPPRGNNFWLFYFKIQVKLNQNFISAAQS